MSSIVLFQLSLFFGWLLMFASVLDLQGFLGRVTLMEMGNLPSFKNLARRQMYVSLALTLLFWGAGLLGLYSAAVDRSSWTLTHVVVFLVLFGAIEATYLFKRNIRNQVMTLPAEDKGTESLIQAVCLEWTRRTLPQF